MALVSSLEVKEQVRQSTDIVDLVGSYLPLEKQGRIYKALCPWHDDSRPSLQVNPDRQTFRCFVCDIGGDVFSFVMQREGVEFREALELLADRAGIELRPVAGAAGGASSGEGKQAMFAALQWAEGLFHRCLLEDDEAAPARQYLAGRGINEASIAQFRIGYAPDEYQWLLHRSRRASQKSELLEAVGMLGRNDNGYYDRFRGRVMFPIHDTAARTIAFGGRILPHLAKEAEAAGRHAAKYINSPETPLYHKSKELYALNSAKGAMQKTKHALVMEGYTDVVVANQFGVENCVAACGTALGEQHVQILKRYAESITLVLDGDEAGQTRASDILDLFIAQQVDLRILTLPSGLDPCDYLFQEGRAAFEQLLSKAVDALGHRLQVATRGVDPAAGDHRANAALEEVLATLAKAPHGGATGPSENRLREEQFLVRIGRTFAVPEETLRHRVQELRRTVRHRTATMNVPELADEQTREEIARRRDPWERELIEILIQEPEAVSLAVESLPIDQLKDPACRAIYERFWQLAAAGVAPEFERVMLEFDDPRMKSLLVELDERGRQRGGSDIAMQLPEVLASFHRRRDDHERRRMTAMLRGKGLNEGDELEALRRVFEQEKQRHGISDSTDG